jgi:type IV pilus assembly protein PilV
MARVTHPRRRAKRGRRRHARGALLIEVLVAILIFSFGILAMILLQGTAVQQAAEAQYRAEAAQLADDLVGQMWAGDRTAAVLQAQYNACASTSCAGYAAWLAQVQLRLPGVTDGATAPAVDVDNNGRVTITVFWRAPSNGPSGDAHRYDTSAQIRQ